MKILVTGAVGFDEVPGLKEFTQGCDVCFVTDGAGLEKNLVGTEVLFGWDFRGAQLSDYWDLAADLKWIHWCGAGVDGILFDELSNSNVVVTNAKGVFDRAMAEYVLGLILMQAKELPVAMDLQRNRKWELLVAKNIKDCHAVIFGVGSIGRETARLLKAAGMKVSGVGRTPRSEDADFGTIYGKDDRLSLAGQADWVVAILPSTTQTKGYFDTEFFSAMKSSGRFINLGRGDAVIEPALIAALESGVIAGAALDVFANEPLPKDDPLWQAPNLIITPHISSYYHGYLEDLVGQFRENLQRYQRGEPLLNLIDKKLGYSAH
ncbi:MAG: D-2-hydroxyacid dehydrogenase [Hyphomicrobiales bacterium]